MEKRQIPAGTLRHQGVLPEGEGIKQRVIDIPFKPQLTACHPIFTPETHTQKKKNRHDIAGRR